MKKNKKTKKSKKIKNEVLNIKIRMFSLSIICILISLVMNEFHVIRFVLMLFSILILTFMSIYIKQKQYKFIPVYILFYLILFILLDNVVVCAFNKIPIFSYNIITTENARVYNALGLRVWQCDKNDYKNIIVDPYYKNGYSCNAEQMDAIDSNAFLSSVLENYSEYKNNYVKIYGKISKKQGQTYIEMKSYDPNKINVNGYVEFADNIVLRIVFNKQEEVLDKYDVYDNIMVVGVIRNIDSNNNQHLIYMSDSKIVSIKNLKDYSISYTRENICNSENKIYKELSSYCINNIYVTFEDGIYELQTALSANKITIKDLISNEENEENDNKDKIYKQNGYTIIECNPKYSNKLIITHNEINKNEYKCPNN